MISHLDRTQGTRKSVHRVMTHWLEKAQRMDSTDRLQFQKPGPAQSWLNKVKHSRKSNQIRFAPKGSLWHHNSATFFRLVRQCMGLMSSQLCHFWVRSTLWEFVVPKLILLFTTAGWSVQPYSINFGSGPGFDSSPLEQNPIAQPLAPLPKPKSSKPSKSWVEPKNAHYGSTPVD